MNELSKEELQAARELCLARFRYFAQAFTSPDFYDDSLHGRLCNFLQDNPSKDKLVVMPRVHLKTTIAATRYPLWRAIRNPNIRICLTSNTQPNAAMTLKEIRGFVENNQDFQLLFPEVVPESFQKHWSDESATLRREENFPEGTFEAAGTGTNLTRRHYDLIIEDDTVAPKKSEMGEVEQMPSREEIEGAIGFHRNTTNLLVRFLFGERLVIGTRWGMFDLIHYIKEKELAEKGGRFTVLDIAAVDEEGKPAYKNFSLEALESVKQSVGPMMFSMLYLNQPLAGQFLYFKPENTKYFEVGEVPEDGVPEITVDPADPPTGRSDQCYWVSLCAKNTKKGLFVLEYMRGRYSEAEGIRVTLDLADKWGVVKIKIEKDRYPHLAAGFKVEMAKRGKHYIVEEVHTRGRNKEARITRLTPLHENGCLWVRKNMRELETEMYSFPRGITLDVLDALAWQVLDNYHAPVYETAQIKQARDGRVMSMEEIEKSFRRPIRLPFSRQLVGVERSFH